MKIILDKFLPGGGRRSLIFTFAIAFMIVLCLGNEAKATDVQWTEWDPTTGTLTLKSGWASSSSTPTATSGNIWRCDETYPSNWQARRLAIADQVKKFVVDRSYYSFTPLSVNRFFNGFKNLEIVDGLQNMDVSKITDFNCMFQGCSSLWLIRGMEHWSPKGVTDMNSMFGNCESLFWVDLSAFNDYGPKANMDNLCYGCKNLRYIFVTAPKTFGKQATSKNNWVYDCPKLYWSQYDWTQYPFAEIRTSGDGSAYGIFHNNELYIFQDHHGYSIKHEHPDFFFASSNISGTIYSTPSWNGKSVTKTVTKVIFMPEATRLKAKLITPNGMNQWFQGFSSLTEIEGLENLDVSKVKSVTHLFDGCAKLPNKMAETMLAKIGKSQATDYSYMFANCTGLNSILYLYDVNSTNKTSYFGSSPKNLSYMFKGCTNLKQIRFGKNLRYTLQPTNTTSMFEGCSSLERIMMYNYYERLDMANVNSSQDMFKGCSKLKGGCGTSVSYTSGTYARIDEIQSYGDHLITPGYFSIYEYNVSVDSDPMGFNITYSPYVYKCTADDANLTLTIAYDIPSGYSYDGLKCLGGSNATSFSNKISISQGTCGDVIVLANISTSMSADCISVTPETDTYTGKTISLVVKDARNGILYQGTDYTITSIKPNSEIKNAGTYQVTLQGKGEKHYGSKTFSVTINPAKVTVTPEPAEKVYGDSDPEISYTAEGLIGSDILTGALSYDKSIGENVGVHKVTQGTLTNSNYNITVTNAEFTIKPKTLENPTIVTESAIYPYTGSAIKPTVTLYDGDTKIPSSEYSVSYSSNEEVGTGKIIINDNPDGNYVISGNGTFQIVEQDQVYKVTVKYHDFATEAEKVLYALKNETLSSINNLEEEGYTLEGIYTDIDCQNPFYINTPITSDDLVLHAKWKINTHKLIFIVNGSQVLNSEVEYGTAISAPEQQAIEGKTFVWDKSIPETMPDYDFTASGAYIINKHSITYILDDEEYQKNDYIDYGTSITILGYPTKTGHKFSGWNPAKLPDTMPDEDITVTGSFIPNPHTITYMENGSTIATVNINYGENIAATYPKRDGFRFVPVTTVEETMPDQNLVIDGIFEVRTYTLAYYVDSKLYKSSELYWKDKITPEPVPAARTGYTFSGWSEIPTTMPADDVNVHGKFTANKHTITYMIDGEVYKTEKVSYGSSISIPSKPYKSGYTFSGWSEIPETMPDKDLIITGSYTKNGKTPVSALPETADAAKVWSYNGTIYIETRPDTKYTITDINGRILTTSTTKSTHDEININQSGILIVIIGNQTFKVMN